MNRYSLWKYVVLVTAVLLGSLYTLPNFFGEAPAVQVSPGRASIKLDLATQAKVEDALKAANLKPSIISLEANSLKLRFENTDEQLKAKDVTQRALNQDANNPDYVVALNLIPRTPAWLASLKAAPMYLGLDLRGGVHFMLQVDMQAALSKKAEALAGDLRSALREKTIRHNGI
jgi:preprotein translocase subunit SecD